MTQGPLAVYRARLRADALKPDPGQALAAEKLQSLHNALSGYRPSLGESGWRARFGLARRRDAAPQGLYLFGGVGRGKTMLMDIFFHCAPLALKRRTHFHTFMLEVQERLHVLRADRRADPLARVAGEIADEAWLLCFDEFQVENIADAMILGRLFEGLLARGVVVVATSNVAPADLYKDGLQRDRLEPFIALIGERLDLLALEGGVDYRRLRIRDLSVYHTPLGPAANEALEASFRALTEGAEVRPDNVHVTGRVLQVPRAARGVAFFTFEALCCRPLGTADYLALARRYHTLVLGGVPRLHAARADEAKRFVNLIDALYENRVKLVMSAAASPDGLYPVGDAAFAFRRAVSRLHEMRSAEYLAADHAGRSAGGPGLRAPLVPACETG